AGMALSHAVARAVWQGLFTSDKPFFRTPKCEDKAPALRAFLMVREEFTLLVLLILCAAAVLIKFGTENQNAVLWTGMLFVQTLPYQAAVIVASVNARAKKRSTPLISAA
ncbi:MAG: hypothetical protein WC464_07410, partial [Bdellovibrionales bacterium]